MFKEYLIIGDRVKYFIDFIRMIDGNLDWVRVCQTVEGKCILHISYHKPFKLRTKQTKVNTLALYSLSQNEGFWGSSRF